MMASHLFVAKPLSEPVLNYGWLDLWEFSEYWIKIQTVSLKKIKSFCNEALLYFEENHDEL